MFPRHHVGPIGFEHPGVRAGLAEHFADHVKIMTQRIGQAQAFGEPGGVDVHHHVDQRLHFRGTTWSTDEPAVEAHLSNHRQQLVVSTFIACKHEVELAFAGMADGGGHAGLDRARPGGAGGGAHFPVDGGAERGAVDEHLAGGMDQEVVAFRQENRAHGVVVSHDSEDHVRGGGDIGELVEGVRSQFFREEAGGGAVHVIDRADVVSAIVQAPGHVGSHATDSDKGDCLIHMNWGRGLVDGVGKTGKSGRCFQFFSLRRRL